jgi:hypothetical protein
MKCTQFIKCEDILKSLEEADVDGSFGTVRVNVSILIITQAVNMKQ